MDCRACRGGCEHNVLPETQHCEECGLVEPYRSSQELEDAVWSRSGTCCLTAAITCGLAAHMGWAPFVAIGALTSYVLQLLIVMLLAGAAGAGIGWQSVQPANAEDGTAKSPDPRSAAVLGGLIGIVAGGVGARYIDTIIPPDSGAVFGGGLLGFLGGLARGAVIRARYQARRSDNWRQQEAQIRRQLEDIDREESKLHQSRQLTVTVIDQRVREVALMTLNLAQARLKQNRGDCRQALRMIEVGRWQNELLPLTSGPLRRTDRDLQAAITSVGEHIANGRSLREKWLAEDLPAYSKALDHLDHAIRASEQLRDDFIAQQTALRLGSVRRPLAPQPDGSEALREAQKFDAQMEVGQYTTGRDALEAERDQWEAVAELDPMLRAEAADQQAGASRTDPMYELLQVWSENTLSLPAAVAQVKALITGRFQDVGRLGQLWEKLSVKDQNRYLAHVRGVFEGAQADDRYDDISRAAATHGVELVKRTEAELPRISAFARRWRDAYHREDADACTEMLYAIYGATLGYPYPGYEAIQEEWRTYSPLMRRRLGTYLKVLFEALYSSEAQRTNSDLQKITDEIIPALGGDLQEMLSAAARMPNGPAAESGSVRAAGSNETAAERQRVLAAA